MKTRNESTPIDTNNNQISNLVKDHNRKVEF